MQKTSIEWVLNPDGSQGYTWNPITGCLNGCEYCYARKLANGRLKQRYLANTNTAYMSKFPDIGYSKLINPFYPRFWEDRLNAMAINHRSNASQKARGYFVCDMGDLFGIGVPEEWTRRVLSSIGDCYHYHRFYLLTKQPQNLIKFSPFPENCWVGVTATDSLMLVEALARLEGIKASVKYVSLEPLLAQINDPTRFFKSLSDCLSIVDWLIIGACTGTYKEMTNLARNNSSFLSEMPWGKKWTAQPNPDWVREIVEAADKAGVKVFLKDNLKPLFEQTYGQDIHSYYYHNGLRQEMPIEVAISERI